MCYLFFLAGAQGFEPRKCQSQSLMPYRLAMPQYSTDDIIPRAVMFVKSFFKKSWKISQNDAGPLSWCIAPRSPLLCRDPVTQEVLPYREPRYAEILPREAL